MVSISEQHQQLNRQIAILPQAALDELAEFLAHLTQKFGDPVGEMDAESQAWLGADLAGDLPEYDWGDSGIPAVKMVRFIPGEGFIVDEVD